MFGSSQDLPKRSCRKGIWILYIYFRHRSIYWMKNLHGHRMVYLRVGGERSGGGGGGNVDTLKMRD